MRKMQRHGGLLIVCILCALLLAMTGCQDKAKGNLGGIDSGQDSGAKFSADSAAVGAASAGEGGLYGESAGDAEGLQGGQGADTGELSDGDAADSDGVTGGTGSGSDALDSADIAETPGSLDTAKNANGTISTTHAEVSADQLASSDGEVFEIREKLFVAQTNDIYYNALDYLGKTLKYEGVFSEFTDPETGETFYSVIRYGPGCCGIDSDCGFEVKWDKGYPAADDWVEAVGVLEEYEEGGFWYLRLALTSLTVLDERGAEYVTQ